MESKTNIGSQRDFEVPLRAQILCVDEDSGVEFVLELCASMEFMRELAADGHRVRLRAPVMVLAPTLPDER